MLLVANDGYQDGEVRILHSRKSDSKHVLKAKYAALDSNENSKYIAKPDEAQNHPRSSTL